MFKTLSLTIATTVFFASTAFADSNKNCEMFFERFIAPVVKARDSEIPPEAVLQQFLMIGVKKEAALNIVAMVYIKLKDLNEKEIEQNFYDKCKGELT